MPSTKAAFQLPPVLLGSPPSGVLKLCKHFSTVRLLPLLVLCCDALLQYGKGHALSLRRNFCGISRTGVSKSNAGAHCCSFSLVGLGAHCLPADQLPPAELSALQFDAAVCFFLSRVEVLQNTLTRLTIATLRTNTCGANRVDTAARRCICSLGLAWSRFNACESSGMLPEGVEGR